MSIKQKEALSRQPAPQFSGQSSTGFAKQIAALLLAAKVGLSGITGEVMLR